MQEVTLVEVSNSYMQTYTRSVGRTCFRIVAGITPTVTADLAAPDGHEGPRVAVGTTPGQDIPVRRLDNGEDMAGALVGHLVCFMVSCDLVYTEWSLTKLRMPKARRNGSWRRSGEDFQISSWRLSETWRHSKRRIEGDGLCEPIETRKNRMRRDRVRSSAASGGHYIGRGL